MILCRFSKLSWLTFFVRLFLCLPHGLLVLPGAWMWSAAARLSGPTFLIFPKTLLFSTSEGTKTQGTSRKKTNRQRRKEDAATGTESASVYTVLTYVGCMRIPVSSENKQRQDQYESIFRAHPWSWIPPA